MVHHMKVQEEAEKADGFPEGFHMDNMKVSKQELELVVLTDCNVCVWDEEILASIKSMLCSLYHA